MWISIKKILPSIINRLGLKKQMEIDKIIKLYPKNYQDKLKPLYFRNKTLFISCPDSIWANELQLKQEEILGKINQHFETKVERIKFVY